MNRVDCPRHGSRTFDLNGPEPMCDECRVIGPDGLPLGWADGLSTEHETLGASEAVRELRQLTTCRCEQAWTDRGLHAPDCLEAWRADVETLAAAVRERGSVDGEAEFR